MPGEGEPIPADLNLRCACCGYELTGLIDRRCPECGESFDPRETWLDNERSTWGYHFENVRTKWDYARLGYLVLCGLFFLLLALLRPITLFALPVAVMGEMFILYERNVVYGGSRGVQIRMAYATVCVAWGVVVALLPW
jgi:hypothetical protein